MAPVHRAASVINYLQQWGVGHLAWPALSPDMNLIETLWADVTCGLNNRDIPPINLQQLRQAILDVWRAIPIERLSALVASMPRRLEALRQARGGHTKY